MPIEAEVYRALQQHLDKGPVGYPATRSGIDIVLLERLFTPEEAKIATCLSTIKLEPAKRIHRRAGKKGITLSLDVFKQKLDMMSQKGVILVYSEGFREKHYKNAGVTAGGIVDFQVNRLTKDLVDTFHKYHEEIFAQTEMTGKHSVAQLRTIPVEKSIRTPEKHKVATYDDVRCLVEDSPGPFAVANCICRQTKDINGEHCKYSDIRETCLQIGTDHARQYVDMGVARYINKEEAFTILDRAQQAGFILQPENSLRPEAICCCCGDCCGLLSAVVKSPKPAAMYASNYYVTIDTTICKGCGTCVKRCQIQARTLETTTLPLNLSLDGRGQGEGEKRLISTVNLDRCIGCGNCVTTCASGATKLVQKETVLVPPKDKDATFMKIMSGKVGKWNMLKLRVKIMLGMDV
jgi:electron transport complex protein RnfB